MEESFARLAELVHTALVQVRQAELFGVLLPKFDLRIACPTVDVDLGAATFDAIAEELVGQRIGSVKDDDRVALGARSDARLKLVKQLKLEIGRVDV